MGSTSHDGTVRLGNVSGDPLINCCTALHRFSNAQRTVKLSNACCDKIQNGVISSRRDLSSRRDQRAFAQFIKAASAPGGFCIHYIRLSFSKAYEKLFLSKRAVSFSGDDSFNCICVLIFFM